MTNYSPCLSTPCTKWALRLFSSPCLSTSCTKLNLRLISSLCHLQCALKKPGGSIFFLCLSTPWTKLTCQLYFFSLCIYYVNQTNLVTLFPLFVDLLRELIFYQFVSTPRGDFISMYIYSVLTWNICEFSTIPPAPPPPPGGTLFLLLYIQYL